MSTNFKSTKFWLAAFIIVISTVLFVIKLLPVADYQNMMMTAMALYAGANVIEKFKK